MIAIAVIAIALLSLGATGTLDAATVVDGGGLLAFAGLVYQRGNHNTQRIIDAIGGLSARRAKARPRRGSRRASRPTADHSLAPPPPR